MTVRPSHLPVMVRRRCTGRFSDRACMLRGAASDLISTQAPTGGMITNVSHREFAVIDTVVDFRQRARERFADQDWVWGPRGEWALIGVDSYKLVIYRFGDGWRVAVVTLSSRERTYWPELCATARDAMLAAYDALEYARRHG
ncbi:hypothetical protein [Nitrobacter sp. TKz-YC02]|uniref:hypothetical protein n=1 Tax=Nitrobacter sp. TKz-YC02 TaxID=3398704 RepID=UPI003CE7AD46